MPEFFSRPIPGNPEEVPAEPALPFHPELPPPRSRAEPYPKIEPTSATCGVCHGGIVKRTRRELADKNPLHMIVGGPNPTVSVVTVYCEKCGLLYDGKTLGVT